MSGGSPLRHPFGMAAGCGCVAMIAGACTWICGTGCAIGGGGGTLSLNSTASPTSWMYAGSSGAAGFSGSLSWTSSPYWSCASRIGSSCPSYSGEGSLGGGPGSSESEESLGSCGVRPLGSVKAGDPAGSAVMNGERVGSSERGGTSVSSSRLGNCLARSSSWSCCCS